MLGGDYSTKLAPWLAAGCLSPRTVYHQVHNLREGGEVARHCGGHWGSEDEWLKLVVPKQG